MGGGGGTTEHSESYSGSGQRWATPLSRNAVGQVNSVFNASQPGLQNMTNIAQNQAVPSMLNAYNSSSPVAGQGNQFNSDVITGKYMNGNPYMDNVLKTLNEGVSNNVNSQFEMGGRYGSGAHADVLSKNLASADGGILYQNYQDEMARRQQAAQQAQAGNLGNAGMLQSMLGIGAELPYTGSNSLANSLGALFNGGTQVSDSKTSGPGLMGSLIGAGSSIASAAMMAAPAASDERLKTNIELVHRDPDGLGWYNFNWRSDPNGEKQHGVMAQEVEKIRPQAFVKGFVGGVYHGVNYGAL